jgi:hypothetical protein
VNRKGDLIRLVSFANTKREEIEKQLKTAFDICIHLEKSYSDLFKRNSNLPNEIQFKWAHSLLYRPLTFYEWTNSFDYQIKPRFDYSISLLEGIESLELFKQHYSSSISRLFNKYQSFLEFNLSQDIFPYSSAIFSHFSPPAESQNANEYPQENETNNADSLKDNSSNNADSLEANEQSNIESSPEQNEFESFDSSPIADTFDVEILQNKVVDLLLQAKMDSILIGMRSPLYVVNIMRNLQIDTPQEPEILNVIDSISKIEETK